MTTSMIPVPFTDDNKHDMLEHGLVQLDASAYEEDAGINWSGVLKRLDVKDMLELRYGLIDTFDDPEEDEGEETTRSAVQYLLRTIEAEVGGRWVGWRG